MQMNNKELIAQNVVRWGYEIDLINSSIESLNNMRKHLIRGDLPENTFEKVTFEFNATLLKFNELATKLYPHGVGIREEKVS